MILSEFPSSSSPVSWSDQTDSQFYPFKSRHGIATATEADWAYYRAHCPRVLKLSKYKPAKSTTGAVNQTLGNCDCNQPKHIINCNAITLNSTKQLKNGWLLVVMILY